MANKDILYQDPVTGVYEDIDKTWYLSDGTPISDYDPKTGAYAEDDAAGASTWYTFQGMPLMAYCKDIGAYQEMDGTWFDSAGNEVMLGSNMYNMLQAYGYNVSNNNSTSTPRVSPNNVNTTPGSKTAKKKASMTLPIILGVAGVAVVILVFVLAKKKK